jgi:hypothetical protein
MALNLSGRERGEGRQGGYPIPYHSEMQRTELQEPWQLTYSGNDYYACPQCAAAYQAMGYQLYVFLGGTHGQKAPSIIPPKLRGNSVYLRYYLGKRAFKAFKTLSRQEQHAFLDQLERANTPTLRQVDTPMDEKPLKW